MEYGHDSFYDTANVGMRSSFPSLEDVSDRRRFDALLTETDVFFAIRRAGYLERMGLSTAELADRHSGIIHVQVTGHGESGPWANRPAFAVTAGAVSGVNVFEGSPEEPRLPPIGVTEQVEMSRTPGFTRSPSSPVAHRRQPGSGPERIGRFREEGP